MPEGAPESSGTFPVPTAVTGRALALCEVGSQGSPTLCSPPPTMPCELCPSLSPVGVKGWGGNGGPSDSNVSFGDMNPREQSPRNTRSLERQQ